MLIWILSSLASFLVQDAHRICSTMNVLVEVACLQVIVRSFHFNMPQCLSGTTFLIYVFHWPLLHVFAVLDVVKSGPPLLIFTGVFILDVALCVGLARLLLWGAPLFTAWATGGRVKSRA